ncbi:hypothetical protein AAFF_G00388560 [Aldrovandia affinis]|uniref:Uncharacterized protein n=1 Tax=Aldrovandia affinis TaxID=143900 RepID=A0AAD7R491_9TELE|nr:hypothetical protein AAFF_G00388560 [Aldrovandia affinis]
MRVRKMKEDREAPRAASSARRLRRFLLQPPSHHIFTRRLPPPSSCCSYEHLINPTIAPTSFYLYPIYPNYTNNNPTLRP